MTPPPAPEQPDVESARLSASMDALAGQVDQAEAPWDPDDGELAQAAKAKSRVGFNVDRDSYDTRVLHELTEASAELQHHALDNDLLLHDVFCGFYKAVPQLVPTEDVSDAGRVNRPIVERLMQDPDAAVTRGTTMLNEMASAVAALAFLDSLEQQRGSSPPLAQMASGSDDVQRAQSPEAHEQALAHVAQSVQAGGQSLRLAIHKAAQDAASQAQGLNQAMQGWGIEPGDLATVPLAERLKLIQRLLAPKVRDLAQRVGRLRNLARGRQRQRLNRSRDEIHSVTRGNDLAHVLPQELVLLGNPVLSVEFYRRYANRELLQYDLRPRAKVGRGPIVCLVDRSGSMMRDHKMDQAIALALGLADTATRQARAVHIAFFDAQIHKEFTFLRGIRKIPPESMLEMATVGPAGGTNIQMALEYGAQNITGQFSRGDLVLVSDGDADRNDAFVAAFKDLKLARGFRLWSILIGSRDPYHLLTDVSDRMWKVSEFTDAVAGDVFVEVAS